MSLDISVSFTGGGNYMYM